MTYVLQSPIFEGLPGPYALRVWPAERSCDRQTSRGCKGLQSCGACKQSQSTWTVSQEVWSVPEPRAAAAGWRDGWQGIYVNYGQHSRFGQRTCVLGLWCLRVSPIVFQQDSALRGGIHMVFLESRNLYGWQTGNATGLPQAQQQFYLMFHYRVCRRVHGMRPLGLDELQLYDILGLSNFSRVPGRVPIDTMTNANFMSAPAYGSSTLARR